ncbi:aminoacyl-tRNA hydrolase [Desulfosediminicola ganghwensis]|uniref:aminoacyl-tRNA hydrolase n=1 Tax=Desulfosediminicola ganghwensis TaxID=2569540 RepID=UPI0010AC6ABC|nr:aminoacyl-tRNA hydrolase [Desulfosediminicola ganghwensis]
MADTEFLVVGLGNPGQKYADTRHNVGFVIIDELARRWGSELSLEKWNARSCRISRWGSRINLVKPMTFMNLSGKAVAEFVRFYKVPVENIVVIHDDLDMNPGRLKLVRGGGAGGHNGIRSMTESLGSNNFYRLKVGIGRPGKGDVHPDFPVDKYVLSSMSGEEVDLVNERVTFIEDGLQFLITEGPARAMSLINSIK